MSSEKRYGNNFFWCFIEDSWTGKEVAIWKGPEGPEGQEEIIARAKDKYEARTIIDALLTHATTETTRLSNKELAFLEFVTAHCVEPYATMASNAILWKDKEVYEDLKNKFPQIYQ
jgi:hypothetical protein